jgi:hypothetical protein
MNNKHSVQGEQLDNIYYEKKPLFTVKRFTRLTRFEQQQQQKYLLYYSRHDFVDDIINLLHKKCNVLQFN